MLPSVTMICFCLQLSDCFSLTLASTEQDVKGGGPREVPAAQRYSVKKSPAAHGLEVGAGLEAGFLITVLV